MAQPNPPDYHHDDSLPFDPEERLVVVADHPRTTGSRGDTGQNGVVPSVKCLVMVHRPGLERPCVFPASV